MPLCIALRGVGDGKGRSFEACFVALSKHDRCDGIHRIARVSAVARGMQRADDSTRTMPLERDRSEALLSARVLRKRLFASNSSFYIRELYGRFSSTCSIAIGLVRRF